MSLPSDAVKANLHALFDELVDPLLERADGQYHRWGGRMNFVPYHDTQYILDFLRDYGEKLFLEH